MALRECRATFRDVRDSDHSVTVHAETTMDAAALRAGHVNPAQGVAQEGDGVEVIGPLIP
jgi:hypothetical protein